MEQQINISLDKTQPVICLECNNDTFLDAVYLRKASKFLVGTSQDALIPIGIMICSKCQSVVPETIPTQLKNKE